MARTALSSIHEELRQNRDLVLAAQEYHSEKMGLLRQSFGPDANVVNPADFPRGFIAPADLFDVAWQTARETDALSQVGLETEPFGGWWSLPMARVRPGEPLDDAVRRGLRRSAPTLEPHLDQVETTLDDDADGGVVRVGYRATRCRSGWRRSCSAVARAGCPPSRRKRCSPRTASPSRLRGA